MTQFRSPLLLKSLLIYIPVTIKMFQFITLFINFNFFIGYWRFISLQLPNHQFTFSENVLFKK